MTEEAKEYRVEDKRGIEHKKSEPGQNPVPDAKPTFVQQLVNQDILGQWIRKGFFPQVYHLDPNTGLVLNGKFYHPHVEIPWIMVNNDGTRECDWYKHVEAVHGFIPAPCRQCWKVVVSPKTVLDLFKLYDIERKMVVENPYCFCKCGIEERDDVERNYGGYFYCNDLEQGLLRLAQVRERVDKLMAKDTPVILKRGCTEFERKYGPSDKWDDLITPQHNAIWEALHKIFKLEKTHIRQPDVVQKHTMVRWIEFAADRGDPTVKDLNGGKPLYPGYVRYEVPEDKAAEKE